MGVELVRAVLDLNLFPVLAPYHPIIMQHGPEQRSERETIEAEALTAHVITCLQVRISFSARLSIGDLNGTIDEKGIYLNYPFTLTAYSARGPQ
jgi:hypothetical protein